MRDALSILDQVAALTSNKIQITELMQLLGIRSKLDFRNWTEKSGSE